VARNPEVSEEALEASMAVKPMVGVPEDMAEVLRRKELEKAQLFAEEKRAVQEFEKRSYGTFSDHPQRFEVLHEAVGQHRRFDPKDPYSGEGVVTYRDLIIWQPRENGGPDYTRPDVRATYENVERLKEMGAIRPLYGNEKPGTRERPPERRPVINMTRGVMNPR
jgi:hypothetical protein